MRVHARACMHGVCVSVCVCVCINPYVCAWVCVRLYTCTVRRACKMFILIVVMCVYPSFFFSFFNIYIFLTIFHFVVHIRATFSRQLCTSVTL